MRLYRNFFLVLILAFFVTGIYIAFYRERSSDKFYDQVLPAATQSPASESARPANVTFNYDCQKGKTAYELLQARHELNIKESELGPMVMGIDGYKVEGKEFWAFYVDGKLAQVGASSYKCVNNEKIQWKIENF